MNDCNDSMSEGNISEDLDNDITSSGKDSAFHVTGDKEKHFRK